MIDTQEQTIAIAHALREEAVRLRAENRALREDRDRWKASQEKWRKDFGEGNRMAAAVHTEQRREITALKAEVQAAGSEALVVLFVPGVPRPQGSKRIVGGVTSRARMIESSGEPLKNWRAAMTWAAREQHQGPAIEQAVALSCVFRFPRPKSHLRRDGSLRDSAPREHTQKPDLGKLIRAVEDSLTDAGIWRDDSLVCEYRGCKKMWTTDLREVGVTIAINAREEP